MSCKSHSQWQHLQAWVSFNLGITFSHCFECSGDLADGDRAIAAHERAVNLTPNDHTKKPRYLDGLGDSFLAVSRAGGQL
jgi:hypothetical protein